MTADSLEANLMLDLWESRERRNSRVHSPPSSVSVLRPYQKFGTVLHCSLSLNEQTHLHTCDEFASFVDILYCQLEQLIRTTQPHAQYVFENESLIVILPASPEHRHDDSIDSSAQLAMDLARFLHHVNTITQWSLTFTIGIDTNPIDLFSSEYIDGLAPDYSRWLAEQCRIPNHIHVSSRIYQALQDNQYVRFQTYLSSSHEVTYLLFHLDRSRSSPTENRFPQMHTSDMIDQLTQIQAEYYVDKHLGTITLTRSLRKRSLFQLTSKSMHWITLNLKEESLREDFQTQHRTGHPPAFIYVFVLIILLGSTLQFFVIDHGNVRFILLFPLIILGLLFFLRLFDYIVDIDNAQLKSQFNRTFSIFFNILLCLTISSVFLVTVHYHTIQNLKYLFVSSPSINNTTHSLDSSQMNSNISGTRTR